MSTYESAEIVRTAEGRQYHIGLAPAEVEPYCMLVGDPARATRVSKLFDSVRCERRSREYVAYTGVYKGIPLTVLATGIGCDNTEIAVIEYCQLVERPTFLRCGSSGALQPEIELGDLIITTGAVKLENTTSFFVLEGYPAVAHHECVLALIEACEAERAPHHVGITASASGFYGAQARHVPGFPPRFPELPKQLADMRVMNFEMETSALFVLSTLRGVRAGAVCAAYASRRANVFIDAETKERAEGRCIAAGLRAFEVLARMDRARGAAARWRPTHGLGGA
jgi:uridine phosphorylase